jgi:hypothetical protein
MTPMRIALVLLGTILLAFAPINAGAQTGPAVQANDAVKDLLGAWEMSNVDRDATCVISLRADTAPGGMKLDFDKAACATAFPPMKDVTVWSLVNDAIRLTDTRGRIAFEFTEVEDGMYESLRAGQPLTFLQNAAAAQAEVATVEQTAGNWNIVRSAGVPICSLTLSNTPIGGGDLALQVKPGCDAAVTRFGPRTWQMDHGELLLKSARGQIWRFEDADGIWQRVPAEADAYMLMRPQ